MNRKAKESLIGKMRNIFSADGVLLARLGVLNAEDIIAIKKRLWSNGINFMFVKNSLAQIVVAEKKLGFLSESFSGSVVVFYSDDLFALMKHVSEVISDYSDLFVLLGGKYISDHVSLEFIETCANLSSVRALYARLLFTISSPARSSLRLLKRPLLNCSRCLKISVDKQSGI